MEAEIITIGDEILIGQIIDTNSAWIAERLNETGIRVISRISVGDEVAAISDALSDAMNSSGVIIITGGLGPTRDDITKQTLAFFFGCGMKEDWATLERNEKMLTLRGIDYNSLNRSQAMVPECCTVLPNPNGTAPGMWFERDGKVVVSLPGVPFEMKYLMTEEVLPRMRAHFSMSKITHKTMATFGLAESILAETIAEWENALPPDLHLAYLPSPAGIRLRLSSYEDNDNHGAIESKFGELEKIIPEYIIGYGDVSVQSAVADMLKSKGKTLAVAESCTGGAISSKFTAMEGASDYFLCGVTSYSNEAKVNVLGVSRQDIVDHTAVSRQVAEQMAVGVKSISGADYTISTTGIAGPSGGTEENPVGTVWIALAYPGGVYSRRMVFGKLREQNIERASTAAINMLRLLLLDKLETPTNVGTL